MAQAHVDTKDDCDGVLLVLFLLGVWGSFKQFIRDHILEYFEKKPAVPLDADVRAVFVTLAAIVLLILLLRRKVMSRIIGARTYEVLRAAFMAVVGGIVLWFSSLVVVMVAVLVTSLLPGDWVPGFVGIPVVFVTFLAGYCLAGFWCGWRFGKWSCFWGVTIALLITALIAREASFWLASFDGALWTIGGLVAAVLGARLGTARSRRTCQVGLPAEDTAPG